MGHVASEPTPFAQWLRDQLRERDWGVRTLARRMNTAEPEVARRALNRYLAGGLPTDAYREQIAVALGITVDDVPAVNRQQQEVAPAGGTFRGDRADDGRGSPTSDRRAAQAADSDGASVTGEAA